MGNLTGWHLVALLVIILLLFGAAKLPALAKSMGQSARVFKGEMKAMKEEDAAAGEAASTAADPVTPSVTPSVTPPAATDSTTDSKP